MIADDSTPFGPNVVVGTVVVVVGTVVVVGGLDVVVVVVDEPEARLIAVTKVNVSTAMPANTRGGDSPRLFFTLPPRSDDALRRMVVITMTEFEILGEILEGSK
jgi:hypothetical protein